MILFVLSAAAAMYVLALYPILLGLLARRFPRPTHKEFVPRTVSIIVAVRNGAAFLEAKLQSLVALDYPPELVEIIVISDGSEDGTDEIARRFPRVEVVRISRHGKCAALNVGIARARNEVLVLTDVRQVVEAGSLKQLVACFADPKVGAVSGTLLIRRGDTQEAMDIGLYWRFETWMREQLSALDSIFGATGPFYAMRRELAVRLPEDCLLDDMYLPLAAFFRGYRLIVEPKAIAYDYPTSLHTEFRRKVRTLAGNYQLLAYYPQLLLPSNRMWLHYLSYKIGRLLLPFALISLLISSCWLPQPWALVCLLLQTAFYLVAWVDTLIPQGALPKKVTSPIRSFVTMMLAALCAVSIFFVSPRALWKETHVQKAA